MVGKCASLTRDGKPCSASPRPGSAYCPWHDPSLSKRRAEWSAKGGSGRSNKARAAKTLPTALMTSDELAAWLTVCLKQVIAGRMAPPVGTAAASIARTITEIGKAAEIEQRIAGLERELGLTPNRRTS